MPEAIEELIRYFSERTTLTDSAKDLIRKAYRLFHLKKKDFLFKDGDQNLYEGFVVNGTLRIFYSDTKGLEHVLYFAFKDWWVGDIASFDTGNPTDLNAQAMEDSYLLIINKVDREKLFAEVPELERVFRIISQKHLIVLQKRFLKNVSSNAEGRYIELIRRHPGIEQLVPQHQIASYLGILPESLSRMKKNLVTKNQ
jgi:CRP-like cAMP-binding protein